MSWNYWTAMEDNILRTNGLTMTNKALMKLLPNRTMAAIRARMNRLGIVKTYSPERVEWTEDEEQLMVLHYLKHGAEYMQRTYFPERTLPSIYMKAKMLGLRIREPHGLTTEDRELIFELYSTTDLRLQEISEKFEVSHTYVFRLCRSILEQKRRLGLLDDRAYYRIRLLRDTDVTKRIEILNLYTALLEEGKHLCIKTMTGQALS